jgi:hypothetical protein
MGSHKKLVNQPVYKDTFVSHNMGSSGHIDHARFHHNGGLSDTKFGKGFSRKLTDNITNPAAEFRRNYSEGKMVIAESINQRRNDFLKRVDSKYDFNPLTGQPREHPGIVGAVPKDLDRLGKRILGDGLGPEVSQSRFREHKAFY